MRTVTTATVVLSTLLTYTSAACTYDTANDITPYLVSWGIFDEADVSGGGGGSSGGSVCADFAEDVFAECIEPYIIDVDFRRMMKRQGTVSRIAARQNRFECESGDVCGAFPGQTDFAFCFDPIKGNVYDQYGGAGDFMTGEYRDADGTTGNFYEGVDNANIPGNSGGNSSGSNSGSDSDSDSGSGLGSGGLGSNNNSDGEDGNGDGESGAASLMLGGKALAVVFVAALSLV